MSIFKKLWNIVLDAFKLDTATIVLLERKNEGYPTLYHGKLDDGRLVYLSYRWGYIQVKVSTKPSEDIYDAMTGNQILGEVIGGQFDGEMNEEEAKKYLLKAGFYYDEHN